MNQRRPAGTPTPQGVDVEDSAPRFSVCIPVYNDAAWLPAAIESVLGQSYSQFELVIGDNASIQAIGEIAAASADRRIRYHRWSEHVPTYENFNRTMFLAKNDWVVPLGADDRLDPRCLEVLAVQIDSARTNPRRLVMVVTASRRVNVEGQRADRLYYGSQRVKQVPEGIHDAQAWLAIGARPGLAPWNIGSIAFARPVLERFGGFRPEIGLSADLDLILRIAAHGDVAYVKEPLLDYTVRDDSDANVRFVRDRVERQPMTPIGAALRAALESHAVHRPVTPAERRAVLREIARTHLRRAGQHRVLPGGHGWAGALQDVVAAVRTSPTVLLSPDALMTAAGALLAPRRVIAWASGMVARRRSQ